MRKNFISGLFALGTGLCLFTVSQTALAVQPGWYLGIGAGQSKLTPEFPDDSVRTTEKVADLTRVFVGYDFTDLAGVEIMLSNLGEAELNNGDTVEYVSADLTGRYRLYDSEDLHPHRKFPRFNIFAKLGVGYLGLDSDTTLEQGSRAHVMVGVGGELALSGGFSLRADLEFADQDALAASLSLVKRFGASNKPSNQPLLSEPQLQESAMGEQVIPESEASASDLSAGSETVAHESEAAPFAESGGGVVVGADRSDANEITEVVSTPESIAVAARQKPLLDADYDGVEDVVDQCKFSRVGYPVRDNGCPKLHGVIRSIQFARYSSELTFEAAESLAGIAEILKEYPDAKVQFRAHTARERSESEQMALTRERLWNMGILLRSLGVTYPQARFYSFGARVPAPFGLPHDRIEIREQP